MFIKYGTGYPSTIHIGQVYYDPAINRFVQLRETHENHLVFSEPVHFYNDAKTDICTDRKPLEYLKTIKKIDKVEKFKEAEYDQVVKAWRVKGNKGA